MNNSFKKIYPIYYHSLILLTNFCRVSTVYKVKFNMLDMLLWKNKQKNFHFWSYSLWTQLLSFWFLLPNFKFPRAVCDLWVFLLYSILFWGLAALYSLVIFYLLEHFDRFLWSFFCFLHICHFLKVAFVCLFWFVFHVRCFPQILVSVYI